jgi:hypothetical protein
VDANFGACASQKGAEEAENASNVAVSLDGGNEMNNHEAWLAQMDALVEGPHHVNDTLERDFERQQDDNPIPEAPASETRVVGPTLTNLTTKKVGHTQLIFEGVCESCAHCGMPLTDSVSVERGIGPICSKQGYLEDPKDGDDVQAMIDLAEYPELVDFLTTHHKPLGLRGLMNGLVKVCSLNRKHSVFSACCDAIQSLGYGNLASVLRESIATITFQEHKKQAGFFTVWVQKCDLDTQWVDEMMAIPGAKTTKKARGILIPVSDANRETIWASLREYYAGLVVKTGDGTVKLMPVQ